MVILGIDLGQARTGVAASDPTEFLASPVETVAERDDGELLRRIAAIVKQRDAGKIVVGHPKNMDGSCGDSARRAEAFAASLAEICGVEAVLWDERLTTVSAIGIMNETNTRGKKRKAVIDTVAATILLQEYLDANKRK